MEVVARQLLLIYWSLLSPETISVHSVFTSDLYTDRYQSLPLHVIDIIHEFLILNYLSDSTH